MLQTAAASTVFFATSARASAASEASKPSAASAPSKASPVSKPSVASAVSKPSVPSEPSTASVPSTPSGADVTLRGPAASDKANRKNIIAQVEDALEDDGLVAVSNDNLQQVLRDFQ